MSGAKETVSIHSSRPWQRIVVGVLAIIAVAAVAAAAIGLWRGTTAYEWRILGLGTLAQAKLFVGFPRWSDQRYEWMEGSMHPAPLASIARDPLIDRTRGRLAHIATKHAVFGSRMGAVAAVGLILSTIAWRHTGMAGRLRRRLWLLAAHPAVRALPGVRRRMRWIAGIPFPPGAESHHIMVSGAAGSGRTALVADLLRQARARGERCVVHDPSGTYTQQFYDPARDVLLNPLDARCPRWSPNFDAEDRRGFEAMSAALIPEPADAAGRFRALAARQLFAGAAEALRHEGIAANGALLDLLLAAPPVSLGQSLKGTAAYSIVDRLEGTTLQSVRALLGAVLAPLRFLPDEGDPVSVREWTRRENGTGWLFLTRPSDRHGRLMGLVSVWAEIALPALLSLDPEEERRMWMVLDDPAVLHRLPGFVPALTDARGLGVRFLIGIPAVGPLRAVYGADGAATISGLCGTRVAMAAADEETADWSSANLAGGERTDAWLWEIRRLPYGHGYVSFPGGNPAAKFELKDGQRSGGKQRRATANRFMPADGAEEFLAEPPAEAVPDVPAGQRPNSAESHPRPKPDPNRKRSRQRTSGKAASSESRTPAPNAAPAATARNSADRRPEAGAAVGAERGDGNVDTSAPSLAQRKRKYGRWI